MEYPLAKYDQYNLPVQTHIHYVSSTWGTTSRLDHVTCTADANKDCMINMSVLYDCIHSDHHPVSFSIDSDVVPEGANS